MKFGLVHHKLGLLIDYIGCLESCPGSSIQDCDIQYFPRIFERALRIDVRRNSRVRGHKSDRSFCAYHVSGTRQYGYLLLA